MSPQALAELIVLYESRRSLAKRQHALARSAFERATSWATVMTYDEVISDLRRFAAKSA